MTSIAIRHAHIDDCPALADILIQATQHAFRGHVPDRCLMWITPEESASNWALYFLTEHSLNAGNYLFVAETESSGVIGFAMVCETPQPNEYGQDSYKNFRHELRSLQIHPKWQRQDIGRRLISRAAEQVLEEGSMHLLVKMLVDNPNMGFYEYLGAVRLGSNPFIWDGYQTEEIIFGWDDVVKLITGQ
jgi:GNAT superfamily N-acetyltransferase